VVECIWESFDFLLALSNFAIEFITITLDFFFFLSSFNNVVCLWSLLTVTFTFASARFVALAQTFVLNSQVFNLLRTYLKFDRNFVSLFFGWLKLWNKNILVNLDFLFALFHRHLQLIFSVFKTINSVSFNIHRVSELLDLKLHNIMLDECFFFLMCNFWQINTGHLILKYELLDSRLQSGSLNSEFLNNALDNTTLVLQLLVRGDEKAQVFFVRV